MPQAQPRYLEIADELRQQIESGQRAPESKLPNEDKLQDEFRASRNTVRDAIKRLTELGLLEAKGREGTFVRKAIIPFVTTLSISPETGRSGGGEEGATYPADVREQGREAGATIPEVKVLPCPESIAARLKINPGERVVSRHQERYIDGTGEADENGKIDGTLWSLQTSYYPFEWVRRGAERLLDPKDILEGAVEYLAEAIGLRQVSYRDLISARLTNKAEQELFSLTHNHTVIEVYRTSFADDKAATPIRVTITVLPADRNQVVYDIGNVPKHQEQPVRA